MNHLSETALEHYLLGSTELDAATVEQHLLDCDDCAAHVRAQIELEMQLAEVAAKATFCPGCHRVLHGDRCDGCGAVREAGGYRIERVLVRSTHGRLYAAVDGNGHRVALKELAFVQAPTLESLAAFDRETKFLRALSHPCIPRFHASFIEGTGIHTRMYIAQDLVEGESLLARLATHWFTEAEITDVARRVLEILVYLQSLSPMVFHRDIKPANLVVRDDGSIALVDFGAARDVSETMGNTAVGTFGYMPLEQMAGVYDATTDLFALGASLLHLLTRREPWKLLDGSAVGVNVSPALRAFLDRLCAKRPEDRFPDARAALHALDHPAAPTKRSRQNWPWIASVVAIAGIGAGVGATVAVTDEPDEPTRVTAPIVEPGDIPLWVEPPEQRARRAAMPEQTIEMSPRLTIEDLLGPGLVWRSPKRCPLVERLPSGRWPAHCAQSDAMRAVPPLSRALEQELLTLSAADEQPLRSQLRGAQERLAKAKRGGIAIGAITLTGLTARTTYYYAVAVDGPFEVAVHGYPRTTIDPKLSNNQTKWLAPVVLAPLDESTGATVVGTADVETKIRAQLVYADRDTLEGPIVGAPSSRAFEATVRGEFTFSGFTPGRYRFTVTRGADVEHFDADLGVQMSFDLVTRAQKSRRPPRPPADLKTSELVVLSKPFARIFVDGVETGTTPMKVMLAPGKHKVTFQVKGDKFTYSVNLKANETFKLVKDFELP